MGDVLYPEYFDNDIVAETKEFYDLFYRYELSDEEVEELLGNYDPQGIVTCKQSACEQKMWGRNRAIRPHIHICKRPYSRIYTGLDSSHVCPVASGLTPSSRQASLRGQHRPGANQASSRLLLRTSGAPNDRSPVRVRN